MSLRETWLRWMGSEQRSIDKLALWGSGRDIGEPVHAGVLVSESTALKLAIVYRCVNLIAGTLASLPAEIVRKSGERREPVERVPFWLDQPNPETNAYEFRERIQESLLIDGNAFLLITGRDRLGFPAEIWTLSPHQVVVKMVRGRTEFLWETTSPPTRLTRFGPTNPLGDVLHLKLAGAGGGRGLSPLTDIGRQAVGLTLVTEKFGSTFFGRGQQMSGVIQLPADQPARSKEHIEVMRESWLQAHSSSDNAHKPAILTGGATWQGITIPPEAAQFLETRRFQVEDIARLYGVPGFLVGLEDKNTSWGTGIEAISQAFNRFTLMPHIIRMETAMSQLLPRGQFYRLNLKGLLAADAKGETDILQTQLQNGVINFDTFRAKLDLPPRPGGQRYMVPANMKVLEGNGVPAAPVAPPEGNNDANTDEAQ